MICGFCKSKTKTILNLGKTPLANAFLTKKLAMGFLQTEVEQRYPLSKVDEAVAHAGRANRFGKIILTGEYNA